MYFDGQLSYLDKDKQPSGMPNRQQQGQRQTANEPTASSQGGVPPQQPPPTLQQSAVVSKSPSVAGTAGDLHSMALKSAINNIGTPSIALAERIT
jgi:hypothetical protein